MAKKKKGTEAEEHLSLDGYFHQLINDDEFIKEVLKDPKAAVSNYNLEWDDRNNERLAIARSRVLEFAKQAFKEVQVLNFRNCQTGG